MFLSRIWFVLVGLLAAVALTAAFVAPRPADRRIEQLEGQRLDRAQYAAEQMLRTDAHRWIDYVAKLGRDVIIAESLESASRGAGEARILHETVRGRLRTLVPDPPSIGLETLVAVDDKGRVVARVGDHEGDYGDAIAGAEVVADALRGYQSDDVWGAGGKLRRVAAAPVLNKTRDHIVGAVLVGAETGRRLADLWKKNLAVDIAVMLRKQVLATTLPESMVDSLPVLIEGHKDEIAGAKRTRALVFTSGPDRLLAVAAPFAGQAAEQDAYYVLIGKMAPASDALALLSSTAADDLRWGSFPWLSLGGGVIAMLAIGLLLQRYETEVPLTQMRRELQRVASGDLQKVDDTRFRGKFGGVARDVNAALERFTHARVDGARSETARKDLNAILDRPEGREVDVPGAPLFAASPSSVFVPPAPSSAAIPAPFAGSAGLPPAPLPALSPSAQPAYATFDRPPSVRPPSSLSSLKLPSPPAPGPRVPSAPPPTPLPPAPSRTSASLDPATLVDRAPDLSDDAAPDGPASSADSMASGGFGAAPGNTAVTAQITPRDPDEAHIREVFEEYVAVRRQCGESTASLTLDKFRTKLAANREQLVAKYHCRTARFSVYVKDGKAAIKATPVRD